MSLNPMDSIVYVNFPGGWRYGFPRIYLNPSNPSNYDYLRSYNVPKWLAEQEQNHLKKWTHPTNTVPIKDLTVEEEAFES